MSALRPVETQCSICLQRNPPDGVIVDRGILKDLTPTFFCFECWDNSYANLRNWKLTPLDPAKVNLACSKLASVIPGYRPHYIQRVEEPVNLPPPSQPIAVREAQAIQDDIKQDEVLIMKGLFGEDLILPGNISLDMQAHIEINRKLLSPLMSPDDQYPEFQEGEPGPALVDEARAGNYVSIFYLLANNDIPEEFIREAAEASEDFLIQILTEGYLGTVGEHRLMAAAYLLSQ